MTQMRLKLSILAISLLLSVSAAHAGTYRNDTTHPIMCITSAGQPQRVSPGQTIHTVYVPTEPGMTEVSAMPYYNPVVARHTVSSSGVGDDQTITLSPATATHVFVWKVTGGNASIFYDATDNTPAVAILRPGDYYQHDLKGRAARMVIQFSAAGTCEVLETREAVK
ncbi:MAG: hypothetical protein HY911_04580 [Desulfobacterales bacterium]|nr:hypothetical protein [Desulfobacterales bacterium]